MRRVGGTGREILLKRRSKIMMMMIHKTINSGSNTDNLTHCGVVLRRILTVLLLFAFVAVPFLYLYNAIYPFQFLPDSSGDLVSRSTFSYINDSSSLVSNFELQLILLKRFWN